MGIMDILQGGKNMLFGQPVQGPPSPVMGTPRQGGVMGALRGAGQQFNQIPLDERLMLLSSLSGSMGQWNPPGVEQSTSSRFAEGLQGGIGNQFKMKSMKQQMGQQKLAGEMRKQRLTHLQQMRKNVSDDLNGDGITTPAEQQQAQAFRGMIEASIANPDDDALYRQLQTTRMDLAEPPDDVGLINAKSVEADLLRNYLTTKVPPEQHAAFLARYQQEKSNRARMGMDAAGNLIQYPGIDMDAVMNGLPGTQSIGAPDQTQPLPSTQPRPLPPAQKTAKWLEQEDMLGRVKTSFESYRNQLLEKGIRFKPGKDKTLLTSAFRDLQLELKELYNLGVLNGPDLDLMNEVLTDPTSVITNVKDEAGYISSSDLVDILDEVVGSKINAAGQKSTEQYRGFDWTPIAPVGSKTGEVRTTPGGAKYEVLD